MGDDIVDTYPSHEEAVEAGEDRFGGEASFLVRSLSPADDVDDRRALPS